MRADTRGYRSGVTVTPPELVPLVALIVRIASPERIILFGSRARGDAGPNSDYDLLVILPDDADRWETSRQVRMALIDAPFDLPIDMLFQRRDDFERRRTRGGHLFRDVAEDGVDLLVA